MLRPIFTLVLLVFTTAAFAQTGCPGCAINLPDDLPMDTIYLSDAPDGEASHLYSHDLSFRLPLTTTPVNALDPDTPAGLGISEMTILGLAGLPPGLSWEASQLGYDLSEEETDGCVRLCGVPLIPGFFEVDVVVAARILPPPFPLQEASFSFPITILPAQSETEGFTVINGVGCGEVTAEFVNNIPSNGDDGFSYYWEFGNGNSTVSEYPQPQQYNEPGVYPVDYQVIVDTAGFLLTTVVIEEVGCNDPFGGNPDLKFVLFDPEGQDVFTAPIVQNATVPVTFEVLIPIEEGSYELHVVDNDGGLKGADDLCGVVNFSQELSGTLTADELTVTIGLIHPIDTLRASGEVIVHPIPDTPNVIIEQEMPYCEGDTLSLIAGNYSSGLQWYQDSTALLDGQEGMLQVATAGMYWATYTSMEGCQSTSEQLSIEFSEPPAAISLQQDGNLLSLEDESVLPDFYTVEWSFGGEVLPGADGILWCVEEAGTYSLLITDALTGCSTSASIQAFYDAGVACSTPTGEPGVNEFVHIYPNPVQSVLFIDRTSMDEAAELWLYDLLGQAVGSWQLEAGRTEVNVESLPAGPYLYQVRTIAGVRQFGRIIKVD